MNKLNSHDLDIEKLSEILQPEGRLSLSLPSYEYRPQQTKMLANIIEAFNQKAIALIEAGTGTGKSIAYLIPAIAASLKHKQRTVISTNTINLQEQLFRKDIPSLARSLGVEFKAALAKGMGNYVCLRKVGEMQHELLAFSPTEQTELEAIGAWAEHTRDGSLSDLNFHPKLSVWEEVNADSETCTRRQCPHYKQCHFFRARKEASEANLVIANHSLLFADLVQRADDNNYDETSILPPYQHLIIDEAHHLEEVATEFFASRTSRMEIIRILGRLSAEKGGTHRGKLHTLRVKILQRYGVQFPPEISPILNLINIDLPGMRRELLTQLHRAYDALSAFFYEEKNLNDVSEKEDQKLRMIPIISQKAAWQTQIIPSFRQFISLANQYSHTLRGLEINLAALNNESLNMETANVRLELQGIGNRLQEHIHAMEHFISPSDTNSVKWMEMKKLKAFDNIHLIDTYLDISQKLVDHLFTKFHSITLCSATMTTNNQFVFLKKRLGIDENRLSGRLVIEQAYPSPFDYSTQVLFAVPTDLPFPNHPEFLHQASLHIQQAISCSEGNAFILFTSHYALEACFQLLYSWLKTHRYTPYRQGEANRQTLLEQFKKTERSVLFGTSSFWEGVDVVGDALRCVILAKLPFKVPSEPIIQARTEAIELQGGNSFMEYTIPDAVVEFKQGFGRLIRNRKDRGCIVCLDTRLVKKPYGKIFLDSLPECRRIFDEGHKVQAEMQKFYTYLSQRKNSLS